FRWEPSSNGAAGKACYRRSHPLTPTRDTRANPLQTRLSQGLPHEDHPVGRGASDADRYGTVDAVGPGVDGWAIGDDVFGAVGKTYLGEGTLAEFATMSAGTIARKPAPLPQALTCAVRLSLADM